MNTSKKIDLISKAMLEAQKNMGLVGKTSQNKFDNYKYANLEDYYKVCRGIFHEHGVFITESVETQHELDGRKTKKGEDQYGAAIRLVLRLTHSSGQWIEISSVGEGQDRGDKGTYKAITGARKYAIAMAANLVTSDDPEKDDPSQSSKDGAGRPRASAPSGDLVAVQPEQYQGEI